jgi:hypothetical protein
MGGSGGGGSFSSKDMAKIQEAAEQRLRAIASKSTKVFFVCEQPDRPSLDALLARSAVFHKDRVIVADNNQASSVDEFLKGSSFLVCFTDSATDSAFIDVAIDKALQKSLGVVHVKARSRSLVPSKISAYRLRSIAWHQLEEIFK